MTSEITNDILVEKATSVIRPKRIGEHLVGDVGCAVLSDTNHIYLGVCVDTSSSMGFCAEHSAIAAMITAGEYRIRKIVALWKDEQHAYILSPCGRCREFIRQIHQDNLETEVILDRNKVVKLAELLPYYDWFQQIQE